MRTGQISVQSENIFPIIKKFLYTDQEIFLRELVSNAVDATKKLSTLSRIGEFEDPIDHCKVEISYDEKAKTLTISDSGIGDHFAFSSSASLKTDSANSASKPFSKMIERISTS